MSKEHTLLSLMTAYLYGENEGESKNGRLSIISISPDCTYVKDNEYGKIRTVRIGSIGKIEFIAHSPIKIDYHFGETAMGKASDSYHNMLLQMVAMSQARENRITPFANEFELRDYLDAMGFPQPTTEEHEIIMQAMKAEDSGEIMLWKMKSNGEFVSAHEMSSSQLRANAVILHASPVRSCDSCNALKRPAELEESYIFSRNETGEYFSEGDLPKVSRMEDVCDSCRNNFSIQDTREDQMHSHSAPLPEETNSFNKFPFKEQVGIELECLQVLPMNRKKMRDIGWRFVHDGSIREDINNAIPVEMNSPPRRGDKLLESVMTASEVFHKSVRVNKSCGFHVHVDWSHLSAPKKRNLQLMLIAFQDVFFALCPPSRQHNSYCKKWVAIDWNQLHTWQNSEKYMGINFSHGHPPGTNGRGDYNTVEFRMAGATRNPAKIMSWIEFIVRFYTIIDVLDVDPRVWQKVAAFNISKKLSLYTTLCEEADRVQKRSPEFLTNLMKWVTERMAKFGRTLEKQSIEMDMFQKKVDTFESSSPVTIMDLPEVYEESTGLER